jgi:hypothetical protein
LLLPTSVDGRPPPVQLDRDVQPPASTIERARPGSAQRTGRGVPQRLPRRPVPVRASSPRSPLQARQRRQNVLLGLVAFALITLAAGVMVSPWFFALHVVTDLALGGFVWVLVEHRTRAEAARARRTSRGGYDTAPLTRRRASGS